MKEGDTIKSAVKTFLASLITMVILLCFSNQVQAAWTDYATTIQKTSSEGLTITFNKAVDSTSINTSYIFVTRDYEGTNLITNISVDQVVGDPFKVKVMPPNTGWQSGTYYLFISSQVKSASGGQSLINGVRMRFNVSGSSGTSWSAMQTEMLGYINTARAEAGVEPLALDKALCDGATLKSQDMVTNNYYSHTSPTYGSPSDMMHSLGITYGWAGENIDQDVSVKASHNAYMNSSGHRANILRSNFKKVGLGFVQGNPFLYVTQWFTD